MTGGRFALLIGSYVYPDEPKLHGLRGPENDIVALEEVLCDPTVGAFSTQTSVNEPSAQVMERIDEFLSARKREDVALLYFSGHGVKALNGELYFAMANTRLELLRTTALRARDVHELLHTSRARQQLLVLDCCYSGAFARGLVIRAGDSVGTLDHFDGGGHAVLTASDAIQYAFEDGHANSVNHELPQSIFTRVLVEGLRSGDADVDRDGIITIDELYEYVHHHVRRRNPSQTPRKWTLDQQGKSIVAYVPSRHQKAAALPPDVVEALTDPRPFVRKSAVEQLEKLLAGTHSGLSIAARDMLERVAVDDDSKSVSAAATQSLQRYQSAGVSDQNPHAVDRVSDDTSRRHHPDAKHASQRVPSPNSSVGTAEYISLLGEPPETSRAFLPANHSRQRNLSEAGFGTEKLELQVSDYAINRRSEELRAHTALISELSEATEQDGPAELPNRPPALSSLLGFASMGCVYLGIAAYPAYSLGSLTSLSTRSRSYLIACVVLYALVCLLACVVGNQRKRIGWVHLRTLIWTTALSAILYIAALIVL